MYNTLTPSKLLEIFTIVERKIQSTIPENIKIKYGLTIVPII